MKEAFPFAHFLGLPQIKAHATEAARRVANSRVVATARSVVAQRAAKAEAPAPTFAELLEQPATEAAKPELTAEDINEIGRAERERGAEIMAAAIKCGTPRLGLALLESGISAKEALIAIAASAKDVGPGANARAIQKLTAMGAIK